MTYWPPHLRHDVQFDHDAAFRAGAAIDEMLARLEAATDHRKFLVAESLVGSEGPFVDVLKSEVDSSAAEAAGLSERLRSVRIRLEEAREHALADQIRLEVARSDWLIIQSRLVDACPVTDLG